MRMIMKRRRSSSKRTTKRRSVRRTYKRTRSTVSNMYKRRKSTKRRSSKRRSSARSILGGSNFDGKVLGFKIPGVSNIVKNSTLQKVMIGAGTVATTTAVVGLINHPTINRIWSNPFVRDATAWSTGDVVGAVGNRLITNPGIISSVSGGRVGGMAQSSNSQGGFA